MYAQGLRYEDVVAAVDVVVTKPGYGIISECLANDTALLYTDRGHFIEYDVLVREMPRHVRCAYLPQAEILRGHWQDALDAVVAAPPSRGAAGDQRRGGGRRLDRLAARLTTAAARPQPDGILLPCVTDPRSPVPAFRSPAMISRRSLITSGAMAAGALSVPRGADQAAAQSAPAAVDCRADADARRGRRRSRATSAAAASRRRGG